MGDPQADREFAAAARALKRAPSTQVPHDGEKDAP
jgi:hypothetical protein